MLENRSMPLRPSLELREIVEQYIGPMVLQSDGSIMQKQSAAENAAEVKGSIAGTGFEPATSGL